jgi:tetratricopeptide (TPR) repeat protein
MVLVLRFSIVFALISAACLSQSTSGSASSVAAGGTLPPASRAKTTESVPPSASAGAPVAPEPNPLDEALALYRKGSFDEAIGKYQDFLRQHPQSPDAYSGLVRTYLKEKKVEQAAEFADKGIAQSDSPRMRSARAEVWFRQGKISEAEKEWVAVINTGYPEARAFLGLARIRDAIAMYGSAKGLIDKARTLDPNDSDIEEEWVSTLPRAQRIKYLEDSLAGVNNWKTEEREGVRNYLAYLKERAKQKEESCRLVSKVTATETPLTPLLIDPTHLHGYGLTVALNGHKSKLLLDTGASGILVTRAIAERAGISKISQTKVGGIGDKGQRNGYVGVANSIKIGDLEFQNCAVEVVEQRSVVGDDGLIGADVFEDFLVEIDFPNQKLKLSQLPKRPGEIEPRVALNSEEDNSHDSDSPESSAEAKAGEHGAPDAGTTASASRFRDRYISPEMQSYTRVFRFGHDLLVPVAIGNVPSKLFLIDTGATMSSISPAAAREVTKVHGDSDTVVKGISGKVNDVFSANKAVLSFGHVRQENQDMISFDTKNLSDDVGTEISGFLGFTTLRFLDIKIDYRDALIDFRYDPNHFGR